MMGVTAGRLPRQLGRVLRDKRERAHLSQEDLARRAGVKRQQLARFESGRHGVTTAVIEAMFEALGLQLRVEVEAVDEHVDAEISAAVAKGPEQAEYLLQAFEVSGSLVKLMRDRGLSCGPPATVLDEPIAACLQGVPMVPVQVDMLVAECDREATQLWADNIGKKLDMYPSPTGPWRFTMGWAQVEAKFVEALPASVTVLVGEQPWRVRPLHEVMNAHAQVVRVVERARGRAASLRT